MDVALGQSEASHLIAELEGAVAKGVEALGKGLHGNCSPVLAISPPRPIRRASVVQPRWVFARIETFSRFSA